MREDEKTTIFIVGVILIFFLGGYGGLVLYSGTDTPFSIVASQSMQHDNNRSQIDRIDTGDMVFVMDKSKVDMKTYVEGFADKEIHFGDYGNVIIYRSDSDFNILHRLILYIEIYEEDGQKYVHAPDLEQHYDSIKNKIIDIEGDRDEIDPAQLTYDFSFCRKEIGHCDIRIPIGYILSTTESGVSGYITMGDNNAHTDQSRLFINQLVKYEDIISVPVIEIPWLGTLKMVFNGDKEIVDTHAPNSIPLLCAATLMGFMIINSIHLQFLLYCTLKEKWKKRP